MSTRTLILAQIARDAEADEWEKKREAIAQAAEMLDALFREDLGQSSTGLMLRDYLARDARDALDARVITAFDALIDALAEAELERWSRDAAEASAADKWEARK